MLDAFQDLVDDINHVLDATAVAHANESELRAVVERISDLVASADEDGDEDDDDEDEDVEIDEEDGADDEKDD